VYVPPQFWLQTKTKIPKPKGGTHTAPPRMVPADAAVRAASDTRVAALVKAGSTFTTPSPTRPSAAPVAAASPHAELQIEDLLRNKALLADPDLLAKIIKAALKPTQPMQDPASPAVSVSVGSPQGSPTWKTKQNRKSGAHGRNVRTVCHR
jgi:hypothetical protein